MKNIAITSRPGTSLSQEPLPVPLFTPVREHVHIMHKLSCGFPSPAADYVEDALDLNVFLIEHKAASFVFAVTGDSMIDAGIMDGDKVIVDRSVNHQHGHIVVAIVDGEFTLKRLFNQGGIVELHAENEAYKPMRFADGQELQIWGVVVGVVRKYRV